MIVNTSDISKELEKFLAGKGKSIIFIHNKEAVEQIALFGKIFKEKRCIIIPTSPEPLFALDKLKLPYQIPEGYYAPEEYCSYVKRIEQKVINFVEEIDRELERSYPEIGQSGLELAFYQSFNRTYTSLAGTYFKIKRIIQTEKPNKIGLLIKQEDRSNMKDNLRGWLLWGWKESLFQKVFDIYEVNLPVHSFILDKSKLIDNNLSKTSRRDRFRGWLQNMPRLYYFLKTFFKLKDKKMALLTFFNQFRLDPLLLLNSGYDWDSCRKELYEKGYYIWGQLSDNLEHWERKNKKTPQLPKNILDKLEKDIFFRESFREKDIDFYPLFKNKISLFLEKIVPASLYAFQKINRLIRKKRIKGVLFSINPTAISKSIAHAAQRSGSPVIGWQHGDLNVKPSHDLVFNDLLTTDLFLGWGQGANENRMEVAKELKLERKQKNVGSAGLDKLSTLLPETNQIFKKISIKNIFKPVIVYATSQYNLTNPHNFPYLPWSDNYFYDTQKKIIERLALLKGNKIIKLNPSLAYTLSALEEYCESFREQNVRTIRSETTAASLFFIADIVIIDLPTTTILQAITCGKPIFCLTRHVQFTEKTEELLKKRVVTAKDPKELMEEVRLFVESGKYKADINNNEFLESFGTHADNRAAERAATAVDELIKDFSSKPK